MPDKQAPAARGAERLPEREDTGDPHLQRLHGVQAARERLRDGRPRDALPGTGDPRSCYGCFGPKETPNTASLAGWMRDSLAATEPDLLRSFRNFNAATPAFRAESEAHEEDGPNGR